MEYITLFDLNNLIHQTLNRELNPHYWVVAEIGEMRFAKKGHCYLEFVEKEGQALTAKMRATILAYDFRNLNGLFQSVTGKKLQAGMKVLAKVGVQYHEVYGLNLLVRDLDPAFTLGERARQRRLILERLNKEGLLELNSRLTLPLVPQRIAVISAQTAAGYGDFINQLLNHPQGYRFKVTLFEATMQGPEAVPSIVAALNKVYSESQNFDVLVLIRGGGSQIDLDCFDDYHLNSKVAAAPVPVLTGIGHERDETLVDLVAHTKLKTPTAVAEFLLSAMQGFEEQLNFLGRQLGQSVREHLEVHKNLLWKLDKHLGHAAGALIQEHQHRISWLSGSIKKAVQKVIYGAGLQLDQLQQIISIQSPKIFTQQNRHLAILEDKLRLADPKQILKRGFSLTYLDGKILRPDDIVKSGDQLVTKTSTRKLTSKVSKVSHE